ncbi:hypothetical protein C6P45_003308 [Maudiozyma exigua]|uniref:MINDY deubiquitinase domain-containing protein n=1 Tax=Maudiozyma exigua TaxID=34358 RepID=A0A9P7BCB4_MAUEX|nr:hypothetical protein C6P45_003308 [Kazachstania exigua]
MGVKYGTKSIDFDNNNARILIQNENGPCALIALVNALVLDSTFKSSTMELRQLIERSRKYVDLDELLQAIASTILKISTSTKEEESVGSQSKCNNIPEEEEESNISQILSLLPSLQDGMNINPIFNGSFKDSPELALFKSLGVKLVHGWLITDDNEKLTNLSNVSYDEVLDMCMEASEFSTNDDQDSNSEDDTFLKKTNILKTFIEDSSTQLTPAGINYLIQSLGNDSLAVLFRNDHFSTLIKKDGMLYTLVTDVGYKKQDTIVWETLLSVDGSQDDFVDHKFHESKAIDETNSNNHPLNDDQDSDEMADRKIALQLQEKEDRKLAESMDKEMSGKVYNKGDKINGKHKQKHSYETQPKEKKSPHHKSSKTSRTKVKSNPKVVHSSPSTNRLSPKSSKDSCTII